MVVLQIEHEVMNFEGWKKAFENNPIDRKKAGVLHYRIYQRMDNPKWVIIDLAFDNVKQAEDMLVDLWTLWKRVDGKIMVNPETRILNLVETKDL
jgi:hypothetical protein